MVYWLNAFNRNYSNFYDFDPELIRLIEDPYRQGLGLTVPKFCCLLKPEDK